MIANRHSIQWPSVGAFVIAIVLLLWTSYYSTQQLISLHDPGSALSLSTDRDTGPASASRDDLQYDISDIVQIHLFGTVKKETQEEVVYAPETKLQLNLVGLIASTDEQLARAIIGVNSSKVKSYAVGQTIEETDATIHTVESRRVLLERGEALESLVLKRRMIPDWAAPRQ